MKRLVFASALLLLLAAVSCAEGSNYQIYSEGKGFMGMGGRRVIMLDKTTGDSWIFVEDKWKPIIKEVTAEASSADVINAKLEAEITAIKEKQAEDFKALQAKHEQELADMQAKLNAGKPAAKTVQQPVVRNKVTKPVLAKKKAETKPEEDTSNQGDEAPPAWLTE